MFRNITLAALLFLTAGISSASAKIWRVNNNAGVAADFTTLQEAHSAAASGDTIHVEGSPNAYAGITLAKKLVIIGPGYFLDGNANTQALIQSAKINGLQFNAGSDGSMITGLDFNSSNVNVYASDITIARNKFSEVSGTVLDYSIGVINLYYQSNNGSIPVTNINITQNFGVIINITQASNNIIITNNYITYPSNYGEGTTNSSLFLQANASATVQNNIFRRGRIKANNSSFYNNIMYAGSIEGTANSFFNNMGSGTQFGTENGNKSNVAMTDVFAGAGTGVSLDAQWKLKAGSPASSAGNNGVDAGMFGGATPYILAGQPSVPAIYYFENSPVGSNSDPIRVTVKVKAAGN